MSEERRYKFAGFEVHLYPTGFCSYGYSASDGVTHLSGSGYRSQEEAARAANEEICETRKVDCNGTLARSY